MRCLLIGNFGVGNLGDEALKEYFLSEFPSVEWKIVGIDTPRLPSGLRSFLSLRWIKTLREFRATDAVVFGGGSLFTDVESVSACLLWWLHASAARIFRKPVHFAFQGVGPFTTRVGEWLAKKSFRHASTISVRDSLSKKRVDAWGLNKKCIQSYDPVYQLMKNKKVDVSSKNVLVLIPRMNSGDKFTKAAQDLCKSTTPESVHVISMQPDKKSESDYCQRLVATLGNRAEIFPARTLDELLHRISSVSTVLTERYHGALAALALGKKVEIIS
jgi:polysaccharide pyruvyl transferase WcaK-like protein